MIRLIASDLDGTLLGQNGRIHPDNVTVLRAAMAQGVHFCVATGRTAASGGRIALQEGFPGAAVIGANGSHVLDAPGGSTVALHTLSDTSARAVVEAIKRHGFDICLYVEHAVIYDTHGMYARHANYEYSPPDVFAPEKLSHPTETGFHHNFCGQDALEAGLSAGALKLFTSFRPGEEAAFQALKAECAAIPGITLTSSWIDNFEIMPEGVSKGTALAELAARLGIAREEVAAFGDNENDLTMLEWAGHGYAMRNATPEVLAKIPHVTEKICYEGGVAHTLRQLLAL